MKKLVLLLVLLLPFFGTSQELVKWNKANLTASNLTTNGSGATITATGGASIAATNWSDTFFMTSGWTNPQFNGTGGIDQSRYVQFAVTAGANKTLTLGGLNMQCRAQGNTVDYEIRYSKSASFSSNVFTLVPKTNVGYNDNNWTNIPSNSFSGVPSITNGETVYIRLYVYNAWDNFHMRFTEGNVGPTINQTAVTTACVPQGNQTSAGNGSWIGYVYSYATTPAATTYLGYTTEAESFNRDFGNGAVTGATAFLCSQPTDNFYVSYKMTKTFQPGSYTFTVGGDDGYRLKIANESGYSIDNWNDHSYLTSTTTKVYNVPTTVDFVLDYYEKGNFAQVSFAYTCNAVGAPTSVTGTTTICSGDSTILTANGTNGPFEWGTGSVGSNIISGQNAATLTVSPTATTTYWVRSASSCRTSASAISTTVTISTPAGDPTVYGTNQWNVYTYNSVNTPVIANYRGFYTTSTLNADTQDTANNGWNKTLSPSSSASWVGCSVPADYFTFVHKRKGFPCGKYEIYMDNWDDNTQVLINGTSVFNVEGWSGDNPTPSLVGTFALDGNSTIDVITKEYSGGANMKIRLVAVNAVYNGSSWSISPEGASAVVNSGTINVTSSTTVCSCTLNGNANVIVKDGVTLVIKENLNIASTASFTVENNGSLVQTNDNAVNTGSINVKRNTTPVKRYDFTYWSAPVGSGFTLNNLSPNTLGDKYYSYNPVTGWVIHYNGTAAMEAGKGYLVRAPQDYAVNTSAVYNGTFVGKPNNGVINQAIVQNAPNLIGNPYASALSADQFYNANKNVIKGTFYFWTHGKQVSTTPDSNGIYQYSADNYISYNATGATDVNSCPTCGNNASNKHLGNIASGQGFFVQGKTNGQVVYNNSMRVTTNASNSQFLRSNDASQTVQTDSTVVEKNRIWLNIKNDAGAYNEALIGYITGATNGIDDAYDGTTYASGTSLYTVNENQNLVIQGRALPFSTADVVPLGFTADVAGQFSIGLDSFDGLFESQAVYLLDKSDNTYHNLKEDRYTFTTAAGAFNSRFEVHYVNDGALGVDNPVVAESDITVYKTGDQIGVRVNNNTIDSVQVYDLTGRIIVSQAKVNSNEFRTSGLNVGTQVVIVKVNLENNQSVSKKVIMN